MTVLALITAGIALAISVRSESPRELKSRLQSLELQFEEVINAVNKWTNRSRVAEARSKIGQDLAPALPDRGTKEYKQFLRMRAATAGKPQ